MDMDSPQLLRSTIQDEIIEKSKLCANQKLIILHALAEKGKPLNSQSSSFWSGLIFHLADVFKVKHERVQPVALALELAMLAGDIFDDTIDQDNHAVYWSNLSTGEAIMVANWLYTKAYDVLAQATEDKLEKGSKVRLLQIFSQHIEEACIGQWQELRLNVFEMSEREYLANITQKSGALMSLAFAAIGALSEQSQQDITSYIKVGEDLGIAMQIENDLHDFLSVEDISSLRSVPTLPFIKALEASKENQDDFAKELQELSHMSNQPIELVRKLLAYLTTSGALEYTWLLYHFYLQRAIDMLDSLSDQSNQLAIKKFKAFLGLIGDE